MMTGFQAVGVCMRALATTCDPTQLDYSPKHTQHIHGETRQTGAPSCNESSGLTLKVLATDQAGIHVLVAHVDGTQLLKVKIQAAPGIASGKIVREVCLAGDKLDRIDKINKQSNPTPDHWKH
jgi:hypothetical protein